MNIYILRCADGSYYTGMTANLQRRLKEHQEGRSPKSYTAPRRPVELVYTESCLTFQEAQEREKQIKGWSRAKKEALITGRVDELPDLSQNRQR
jgi:putative endonuclease